MKLLCSWRKTVSVTVLACNEGVTFCAWKENVSDTIVRVLNERVSNKTDLTKQGCLSYRNMASSNCNYDHHRAIGVTLIIIESSRCNLTCYRWGLQTWRENCRRQVAERRHEQAASVHFNRQLLTKVWYVLHM